MTLDITDLFVVGLALDITGAGVLARGLLVSPAKIGRVTGSYWNLNAPAGVDRCESRVDGFFGIAFLATGFALQAVGFLVQLAGSDAGQGGVRVLTAAALGLAALGIALGLYLLVRPRFFKRTVLRLALDREDKDDAPAGEWSASKFDRLTEFTEVAGWPKTAGESDRDWIERVYRVALPDSLDTSVSRD